MVEYVVYFVLIRHQSIQDAKIAKKGYHGCNDELVCGKERGQSP
jgi:hypothetical protein